MRVPQIGVIGSMADLNYTKEAAIIADKLGQEISAAGAILVFGAEKDSDSLPTVAARAARKSGGVTMGVTYEKGLNIFDPSSASVVVATGLVRGGGRELAQSLSCDVIIAVGGGSGTLNEITVAYQANIPVVVITGVEGWSSKLKNTFLDARKRYKFEGFTNPESAVKFACNLIEWNQ